jgi:hypothetical protein
MKDESLIFRRGPSICYLICGSSQPNHGHKSLLAFLTGVKAVPAHIHIGIEPIVEAKLVLFCLSIWVFANLLLVI